MDFFLECLPIIERIVADIARRHRLSQADAAELLAFVHERLIDNDYAILRKFENRSSVKTFLTVVAARLFKDLRNAKWGRWRVSAIARRMGPIGMRLEELLMRDGCSLRVASEILRAAGYTGTDAELARMAAKLPQRHREVDDGLDAASKTPDPKPLEEPLRAAARERMRKALIAALMKLPAEDRLIIRMHFWDLFSVADIARTLKLHPKPLYRRLEAIVKRLRKLIGDQGISDEDADDWLTDDGLW